MRGLTGALGVVLTVFVLTAVPIGVLAYSAGLTDSLSTSVAAKSGTYNGADYAFDLRAVAGLEPDPDLRGQGTFVNVVSRAKVGDQVVQLLGIEPDRFADFAAWNVRVVGAGPDELLGRMRTPEPGAGPLPVLLVGDLDAEVTAVDLFRTLVPVEVVGTADSFPGLRAPTVPMLVVDRGLLDDADRYADREIEVWTDAEHAEGLVAVLAGQDVRIDRQRTPETFVTAVDLLPITWAFGYLQVIAALTGLIAVAALLLYLALRQRQRFAAYHLARRMGMRPAGHIRALALEVGLVLGGAWLAGVGLGLLCVASVYRLLELNPTFPPPPLFAVPAATLVWTAAATVIAVAAAALVGHAAARNTQASDVLRIA